MIPLDVRYWVKLHHKSQPIETVNLRNMRNDIIRNPESKVVRETIYPTYHKFESDDIRINKKVDREMSDTERSNYITQLFNKSDQYLTQRKKSKIKSCRCK